jgi:hypothetical protein
MSENISDTIACTRTTTTTAISDLCEKAAKELKQLDTKKVEIIQNLAKEIEQRGVPKGKVARIVVRELVSRDAASPGYIYECLGIEQKEKEKSQVRKKDMEQSAKVAEPIVNEQYSKNKILVSADSSHIHEYQSGSEPDEISRWVNPEEAGRLEQLESQGKQ